MVLRERGVRVSQRSDGTWPHRGGWNGPQPESSAGSPQEREAAPPFRPDAVDQTVAREEEITHVRGMPPIPADPAEATVFRDPVDDRTLPATGRNLPHSAPAWDVSDPTVPPPAGARPEGPQVRSMPAADQFASWAPPGQAPIADPGPPTVVRGSHPGDAARGPAGRELGDWEPGASGISRPIWYEPQVTDQPTSAGSAGRVELPPPAVPLASAPPAPNPLRATGSARAVPPPTPRAPAPAPSAAGPTHRNPPAARPAAGSGPTTPSAGSPAEPHAEDLTGWQGWVARRVRDNKLKQREEETAEAEPRTLTQKVLGATKEIAIVLVLALIASGLFRGFVYQVFEVPSGSMELTLAIGDKIAVQKFGGYERGDVIVLEDAHGWLTGDSVEEAPPDPTLLRQGLELVGLAPDSGEGHLVKRVIGLPGDRVTCCDASGRVEVNGYPLDESYTYAEDPAAGQIEFEVVVPEDRVFVLGDHRNASGDSRCHLNGGDPRGDGAFIPRNRVTGKVVLIVLPTSRFQRLERPQTFAAVPAPQQQPPPEPVVTDPIGEC